MFHKILVGTDGRDGGLDAVALACRLLAPDGELLLAHIHHGYPISARAQTGDYERVAQADATALLARAGEQTGISSRFAHGATSVGRGLQELAERERADLVVIGATRRTPITHMFAGDATRETVRAVHGAVAVAPVGYADRPEPIRTVAVAYDASRESRAAAAVARGLAEALHAQLAAIQVLDLPMYIVYSDRATGTPERDPLKVAAGEVSKLGAFEPRVSFGYVGDELAKAAGTVDLLVMGSRTLGPIAKLLSSSRSQHLAGRATCPLLILSQVASATHRHAEPTSQPVPLSTVR